MPYFIIFKEDTIRLLVHAIKYLFDCMNCGGWVKGDILLLIYYNEGQVFEQCKSS